MAMIHQKLFGPALLHCSVLTLMCAFGCEPKAPVDYAAAKAQIDSILKVQEDAYDLNNEVGRKILVETCVDSLMFIGGEDGGLVQSADFYVHDLADGYSQRPANRTYRIFDNTAIVSSVQQTFKVINRDTIFFNSRSTKVFIRIKNTWKMTYVSFAPLPVLYHKVARVDDKLLQTYAGLYRSSEHSMDTISVSNGKVFLLQGGNPKSELFPLNDSVFFGDGYFGNTIFSKNRHGRVTHMYYQYPDGQRIIFPKVR